MPMSSKSKKRPADDAIAKVLDWVGLAFGISVLLLVTNLSLGTT